MHSGMYPNLLSGRVVEYDPLALVLGLGQTTWPSGRSVAGSPSCFGLIWGIVCCGLLLQVW